MVNPAALRWARAVGAIVTVQDHRYFCPGRGKWTREGVVCRDPMSPAACDACFESPDYFRSTLDLTRRRLEAIRGLRLIVLSQYMKAELAAAGVDASGIEVIPPFVHGLDEEAVADGPPCLLFVGRLTEHKGARDAVEVSKRSGVGLPLVMAGTGPLRAEIEGSGARVLGWLDPPSLSRVYRRARALLMPSRWQEPFGIAGLEALTMGVPVVAWESGGIFEWNVGAPRVAWGDVDGLASALRAVCDGQERAAAPVGYDRGRLMQRLLDAYRTVSG